MPSPFPGMDPFIESQRWRGFHSRIIGIIAEFLDPLVDPRYVVDIDDAIYVANDSGERVSKYYGPDLSILQQDGWMENADGNVAVLSEPLLMTLPESEPIEEHFVVLRKGDDDDAVTVIELLSPTNKDGRGREQYLAKREEFIRSDVNIVEIDLLRGGKRLPTVEQLPPDDYFAFVSRADRRPNVEVYHWRLADVLPSIRIPLAEGDPDVVLDLQAVFNVTYERGYTRSLRYDRPILPKLTDEQAEWVEAQLAARRR